MKTNMVLLFTAIFTVVLSCNSDPSEQKEEVKEEVNPSDLSAGETVLPLSEEEFPQEWQLVTMSGMLANSETSGEEMEYQEIYRFLPDQTFSKTRIQDDSSTEASGTFSIIRNEAGEEYFKLSYSEENVLIENCDGGKEEWLLLDQEKNLRGTANACDHLSKTYRQI